MSNTFYGGVPVEDVDFNKKFLNELTLLKQNISDIENRYNSSSNFNSHFWTLKLSRANKALENGRVTIDGN